MQGLELFFVIVGVVGFVFLLASLVLGELGELIGDADTGTGADIPTPEWHDLKVIAAGAVGFGAFGFIAHSLDASISVAMVCAALGFIGISAGALFGLLKPLARQQSNSLTSHQTYVGKSVRVVLPVSSEQFGLVEFYDDNGALVRQKARTNGDLLPKGSTVLIFQVDDDAVLVSPDPSNPIELQ